jgi:hypothetical protein
VVLVVDILVFVTQDVKAESIFNLIFKILYLIKLRRKKFESPQQPPSTLENPFSARGAIRRQSLRDRSGMSLARLEAQREGSDLIRSYNSKEDLSTNPVVCFVFLMFN